ncbi:MAG: DUF2961 domain-containing protein [Planctomycetota bacterium]|nr:DUF2961 domain-containing protein [Planctomycetota bacterium]
MTNLAKMAEFPAPAYTCKQFSSYDRASKSPTENWFANNDCGQYLRVEDRNGRKEYVMMDAPGPGAIVRIWSANPAGNLRIYIDGAEKPALESPMNEILGGKYLGLHRPIAGEYSKGWNLYLPMPYAKSCKVTSDKGGFYYHVNYRTYPADTKVASFSAEQIKTLDAELKDLAAKLAAPGDLNAPPAGAETKAFETALAPGAAAVLGAFTGPQAVRRFRVLWAPTGDREEPALRGVVVQMTFDGETTVAAPLGDLFGTAPGINPYESLPLSVAKDGRLDCRWVMPFKKTAEVKVTNHGKAPVALKGEIVTAPYTATDATMLFHAKCRIEHDVPTEPKIDWNYMTAKGKGVFAGVAFAIDNPVKDWWGEGDEKIYVDGETFPSHFGTGTEDYYGYAWCFPALFTHAYHNQTRCDGPGNFGRTSVNRFHILDRIPFTTDFRFDMELWHWKKCNVNMAVTDYWYAMPGATDGFKPLQADDVALRPVPEPPATTKVKGAIEGEEMKIIEQAGTAEPQDWEQTSGGRHLWWHAGHKPGDTLVLGFNVKDAGTYRVSGRFLKAADYGIAQFAINGQKAGDPIDFYNDGVIVTPDIELGTFELKAGENKLSVTITGANEKAAKAYMVGIDYLLLKPAK